LPRPSNERGFSPRKSRIRGIAIETIARQYGLGFIPAQDEHYDFIVPRARLARPAVQRFRAVLEDRVTRDALTALGFGVFPALRAGSGDLTGLREGTRGVVKLTQKAKVDPNKLLQLIAENPQARFTPNGVLSFPLKAHGPAIIEAIEELLQTIAA